MNFNPPSQVPFRRFMPWFVLPVCFFVSFLPAGLFAQTVAFTGVVRTLGSGFSDPGGVVVDGSGNVFVTDEINNAVYELLAVGGSIPASPTIRTLGSGFQTPSGVAVDGSGNVYVADAGNNAVKEMLAVGGSIPDSPTIRTLGSGFSRPTGVAVDSSGNVYVADFSNGIAKEILAVGGSIPTSPSIRNLVSGFGGPIGVAVDGNGNVYVADYQSNKVFVIEAVGGSIPVSPTLRQLGGSFQEPSSVAVDGSGNVYVSDVGDSAAYEMLAFDGSIPSSPTIITLGGGFSGPNGVTVDSSGNVYIADTFNSAVKEILASPGNFSSENLGSTSVVLPFRFTFTTGGTGLRTRALTEGVLGLDFADAGTGSCTTNGTSHAYSTGDICTVDVTFAPRYAGLRRGAMQILNVENGDLLASVPIYGVGIGPQIGFVSSAQAVVGDELGGPVGVAVNGQGDVFIADQYDGRVIEAPADGGPQITVAVVQTEFGQLAMDGAGDLFLAVTDGGGVLKVPARGNSSFTVGSGLFQVAGVAVDGAGNVFIADYGNNIVAKVPADGSAQNFVAGGLNGPEGIAVDGGGNLFIANTAGKVVDEVVPGNSKPLLWASGFSEPFAVALDAAGDVFVPDYGNSSLVEAPIGGGAHILLGNNSFNEPEGVAVDGAGDIFVADSGNKRVVELPYSQPPSLVFSSSGSAQTVTLENIGNLPLVLPGIVQGTNPIVSNGSFTLNTTGATACAVVTASSATPGTLAPGHTCDLIVTFSPTNGGTQSGTLVLTDNSLNASPTAFTSQSIPLSGAASANVPDITWPSPAAIAFGTALSATQLNATANVAGTFSYSPAAGAVLGVGTHTLSVTFTPTNTTNFTTASTTVTLTVNQAVPAITWVPPTAITFGTVLSSTQLDATSAVAGTFAYNPPAGTGFPAGLQTLSATFTPTDTTDYTSTTASVSLTVNKAATTTIVASSLNPSVTPHSVTFTATVTSLLTDATGTVTFKDGSTVLGSGTLNSSGVATYSTSTLTVGKHSITAVYAGDNNNLTSTSVALSQVVNGVPTVLTSPTPSTVLAGPKVTFIWATAPGASSYIIRIGTTVGANNLYSSGSTIATSYTPTHLPTNGETINVRLVTNYGSSQIWNDYTYTAATQAAITSPAPSSVLAGPNVTFTWSAGTSATGYSLSLGTTVGSNNLYYSGTKTATTFTAPHLPTNGETIYARLTTVYGASLVSTDYTYSAATQAALTSPTPGSVLAGPKVTFTWTAAPGATGYIFRLGTTVGGNDLYSSGTTTATSRTPTNLPTNGEAIFAQLVTEYGSSQVWTNYTYTAAP